MGPRRRISPGHNRPRIAAAMEEGRDGPSEGPISGNRLTRAIRRNGGGPRWALGGCGGRVTT